MAGRFLVNGIAEKSAVDAIVSQAECNQIDHESVNVAFIKSIKFYNSVCMMLSSLLHLLFQDGCMFQLNMLT
jgi:hypothetical protein